MSLLVSVLLNHCESRPQISLRAILAFELLSLEYLPALVVSFDIFEHVNIGLPFLQ